MKGERKNKIYGVITYIIRNGEILLIYKKRGHGKGKWNGPGGKIENETPEKAAIRETREETGIKIKDIELTGIIEFFDVYEEDWVVFIYRTEHFEGQPVETEECFSKWFKIEEIPYHQMWEDDMLWLPYVIENKPFLAKFWFREEKMLKHEIENVERQKLLEYYQKFLAEAGLK